MCAGSANKKLVALGRHWAGGGQGGASSLESDAAAFGIALKAVEKYLAPDEAEIWPEHLQAWEVYSTCDNQWRVVAGMGGVYYQGLELSSVTTAMELCGVEDRRTCMAQVRAIESGAREVLNR